MYILTVTQEGDDFQWLSFTSEQDAVAFLSLLPGYTHREEEGYTYHFINIDRFPLYEEVNYQGVRVPISRYIFREGGQREVYFIEIPSPDLQQQGLLEGTTPVDAYSIPNGEMKGYIAAREDAFRVVKHLLEIRGYEVSRAYQGSEDGEAILYRKKGSVEWHFLGHMDPTFAEAGAQGEAAIMLWLKASEPLN